jgi:hypothetical protein
METPWPDALFISLVTIESTHNTWLPARYKSKVARLAAHVQKARTGTAAGLCPSGSARGKLCETAAAEKNFECLPISRVLNSSPLIVESKAQA